MEISDTLTDSWFKKHESKIKEFKYTLHLISKSPLSIIGAFIITCFLFIAVFAPFLAPHDPYYQEMSARLEAPSFQHPLGTDDMGRDILSRIIYGSRISVLIGIIVVLIGAAIGIIVGAVSGYIGGAGDNILMRIADMFLSFPPLILAMAIAAALGPNLRNTIIAIALVRWPVYARLVRSQVLSIKNSQFIEAIRSMGGSDIRILFIHILPNCLSPIIVRATMDLGTVILAAAGLSFIGFGAQPPLPEWGAMVSDGRQYIVSEWWVATFPGLAILMVVVGFNILGDGLRDVLDPRLRR